MKFDYIDILEGGELTVEDRIELLKTLHFWYDNDCTHCDIYVTNTCEDKNGVDFWLEINHSLEEDYCTYHVLNFGEDYGVFVGDEPFYTSAKEDEIINAITLERRMAG